MSGDWIKMRTDLLTDPRVVRISSALNADRLRTVGGLHAVWSLFDTHSADGTLEGYTYDVIDDLIGWPGFCKALEKVGWVTTTGESVALPRFEEHNGRTAKRRAMENDRKKRGRVSADDADEDSAGDADTDADKKRAREEKRREEREKGAKTPKRRTASKRCPPDFVVTDEMRAWAKAEVPGVNVELETAALRDYEFKDAKTDWVGTWRNWLRRASAGSPRRPAPRPADTGFSEYSDPSSDIFAGAI